ncbi:MAG TPA: MlaD family protein [Burkholderiaceae bacterium]|nr:MlaD family protein [Burkholderiaceae bacterium]
MEPDSRYALIGAVLLALATAAVVAFVWLSSAGRASDYRAYTIYFERQSLEGLQVGGDVNMRGLKVGRVEEYTISRDNINRVAVTIRIARETPVSENTTAVIARNFLTGIARINLETPGTPGPELVAVKDDERYPVIPEGTSNIDQIADAVGRLALQADTALENLNRVMGPANQRAFSQTLTAVRDLSRGLNDRLDTIDDTAKSLQRTASAFERSSRDIAGSVDRVSRSVEPLARDAGAVLQEARASLREFLDTSVQLERQLGQSLARLERDTGRLAQRADDAVDIGVHELRATSEELRANIELITRTIDRLQDPKALLLGPSSNQMGPGERGAR